MDEEKARTKIKITTGLLIVAIVMIMFQYNQYKQCAQLYYYIESGELTGCQICDRMRDIGMLGRKGGLEPPPQMVD